MREASAEIPAVISVHAIRRVASCRALRIARAGNNTVEVRLGWPREGSYLVFSGTLADVESFGQKRGGRTLMIMARGVNLSSKTKQQVKWSLGDGTDDKKLG